MAAEVGRMKLGSQGMDVSSQGLGCMGMSAFYGSPKPEPDMIRLIHRAVNSGVTFLDTSDIYGPFTNELLLVKALKRIREKVQLATKFGISFVDGKREIRGDPAYVRACCEAALRGWKWNASICTTSNGLTPGSQSRSRNGREMAARKGCTPSQLALAWVHHQGPDVCPIPGTTKIENLNQNIGALSVKLTPEEMAELESCASTVKGGRYPGGMVAISSWRRQ